MAVNLEIHTLITNKLNNDHQLAADRQVRTVCVFHRLFLLGWLRYHLYSLALKDANVAAVAVEQFHVQHEMFAFVRV